MTKQTAENPVISEQLRRKAEIIALFMGGDYNMTVGVGPYGSGWHWDFVKNHVNMDAKDLLEESEDVVKGVAAHEGNHKLASRPEHVKDLWTEPGFAFGLNAVEDPRVNQAGSHFRPGSKDWIRTYIERDLGEGGGLDYKSINQDAKEKLGYVPKHMQWGGEMIRYWYEKEFTDHLQAPDGLEKFLDGIPDKDVKKMVADSIPAFEEYYNALPQSRDEMEVQKQAKKSADIFKDKIWPEYKKLVDQSYQDQSFVQMIEDMLSQDGQGQGQGGTPIPFDSLPQEIQDEIKKKIKEQMDKKQQGQGQSGQKSDQETGKQPAGQSGGQSGSKGDSEKQDQQKEEGQPGEEPSHSKSESQEGNEENAQAQSGSGAGGRRKPQVPWDQLSQDAKDAIEQAFDNLPKDEKEKYQQQAKESMEDAEDDANEKLRGQMNDPRHTETNKERNEREEQEQKDAAAQRQAQQQIEQMLKERKKILDKIPANPYFEVLSTPEIQTIIRMQDRAYKRIFKPDEDPDIRHSFTGLRPDMKKAMQFEADRRKSNIFENKGRAMERSHRFLWLFDMSSSMSRIMPYVFEMMVINTELDSKHGLEDAVVGFTDGFAKIIRIYKDFAVKRLTNQDREELGKMLPEFQQNASGTPTVEATKLSYRMLKERMKRRTMLHNYFITITDGQPNEGPEALLREINQLRKDKTVVTCGFGIGPGTEFVNRAYPKLHERIRRDIAGTLGINPDAVGNNFKAPLEFAQASVIIMGYMVEHPELFYG